ncbi:MAG TPA: FKBP-type peptidyl-prolyl cis-trans isomerase [Candidatus Sulfotelmatobacter sp.]|nr:FKBP-type peptidyl-prolyl cis-trans isomerase [Candidatus Sulfotelmatobacter sp.]
MRKPLIALPIILITGLVVLGAAVAQQSTTKNQTAPAKTGATPAKKGSAAPAATPAAKSPPATALTSQKDKISYALGMNIASSLNATLKRQNIEINTDVLGQALKDGLSGNKTLMTEEEARATLMQLQGEMQAKQEAKAKEAGESNKKEGDAFLAANKAKPGVITLPSGLQYKVIKEGTGAKPTASDSVVCNYRGTLINGKEFDSSYKRGEPATFPVGGVIKGWTEALQLMPVGSKWELYIPPDLAYGPRGAGSDIGPNATLVFEIELISIQGKEAPQAAPAPSPAASPTPAATPKK